MTRRIGHLVMAVLVTVGAASCGLPNGDVTPIDPKDVPFGLTSSLPATASPGPQGPPTSIYLVAHDRLVAASRRVVGDNIPAESVRSLLAGPTPAEGTAGLSSDVPAQTRLISLDLTGPIANVDLSDQFGTVGGSDQVLAVAQLVYTLTTSPYIRAVRFSLNGKRIEVPDASGSLSSAPRTRDDYRQVAPARG